MLLLLKVIALYVGWNYEKKQHHISDLTYKDPADLIFMPFLSRKEKLAFNL